MLIVLVTALQVSKASLRCLRRVQNPPTRTTRVVAGMVAIPEAEGVDQEVVGAVDGLGDDEEVQAKGVIADRTL